jgi:hypothetical protein
VSQFSLYRFNLTTAAENRVYNFRYSSTGCTLRSCPYSSLVLPSPAASYGSRWQGNISLYDGQAQPQQQDPIRLQRQKENCANDAHDRCLILCLLAIRVEHVNCTCNAGEPYDAIVTSAARGTSPVVEVTIARTRRR